MKHSLLKYIFFIFVLGIILFAAYKVRKDAKMEPKQENSDIVEELTNYENKEINLGIAEFDTMNPIISNNKYVQEISKLIFEPLLTLNENYKIESCLATEWAKASSNSYILKLNDKIYWPNGQNFTAQDVIYTVDKIKSLGGIYLANVENIANVEMVDNYTIRINLIQEQAFFEYNLTFPILCSTNGVDQDFAAVVPIGTGMYQIAGQANNSITLTKNATWWKKPEKDAIIEKINIVLFSSVGEYYNAFKLGQIDLITSSNLSIDNYIGTIGYTKKEFNGREYDYLAINTQNAILSDVAVRKAINHAINKESIIENVFNGKYFSSKFPLNYGNWLYNVPTTNEYNLELAKNTLLENGWEYKYKNWQKYQNYTTQRLNFRLVVKNSNEQAVAVAELIKTQLEELGMKITVVKASDSQYSDYLKNKSYDLIIVGKNITANPDMSSYLGNDNLANYNNEELINITNEVKNITDEKTLREKYNRIADVYSSEAPYISLYNNYSIVAYSSDLRGQFAPNWFNIFLNFETWHK